MIQEEFNIEVVELNKEFAIRMNKPDESRQIITDGVMFPEIYFSNDIRLCWVLKEPYDRNDGTGGDWSIFDMFPEGEDLYEEQFKHAHKPTWQPIIYISNSIFNNFKKWNELEWIRDNHKMCDILRQVAIVNTQKLPSKGVTVTNEKDLIESIENYSDLLKKQLELLNPTVYIFANTAKLYEEILDYKYEEFTKKESLEFLEKDGKLFINAYHPAQKTITRELYVNEIVSTVEEWKNK